MSIEARHRAAVRTETMVSMAINAFLPATLIWLLDISPPQQLIGDAGILKAMIPAAGAATLLMTMTLTLIVRVRVRRGSLPALDWPDRERGVLRFLPRLLPLRAATLGAAAVILLVPPALLAVAVLPVLPLSKIGFLLFNIVFGALVGAVMARFVVLPALADGMDRRRALRRSA